MANQCEFCNRDIQNKQALKIHEASCKKLAFSEPEPATEAVEASSKNSSGIWAALTIAIAVGMLAMLAIKYLKKEPKEQEPTQQVEKPREAGFTVFDR